MMSIDLITSAVAMYNSLDRWYHDYDHVEFCLKQVKLYSHLVSDEEAVRTALFFHDVIYVPGYEANELESAAWAIDYLDKIGASARMGQRVHELIMDTTHKTEARTSDGRLVQDIDLLGFAKLDWRETSEGIRWEFRSVPGEIYWPERLKVLRYFAGRRLYYTEELYEKYEDQAKAKIEAEMQEIQEKHKGESK
jgi:predicted metal-dependent HD superfamily phosphohydrolase